MELCLEKHRLDIQAKTNEYIVSYVFFYSIHKNNLSLELLAINYLGLLGGQIQHQTCKSF